MTGSRAAAVSRYRVVAQRRLEFGPTVRADISPVRRRTEGPFAGWESGSSVGARAESPRKSPPHTGPGNLCGPTARAPVFLPKPSPDAGSACAVPVSGLGWYRLGPSARNGSKKCVYSSGLKSTSMRGPSLRDEEGGLFLFFPGMCQKMPCQPARAGGILSQQIRFERP